MKIGVLTNTYTFIATKETQSSKKYEDVSLYYFLVNGFLQIIRGFEEKMFL